MQHPCYIRRPQPCLRIKWEKNEKLEKEEIPNRPSKSTVWHGRGSTDGFASRHEATLQDIPETMQESDIFTSTGKDVSCKFWTAYERVAKENNNDMDVHLIFVRATLSYPSQTHRTRIIQAGLFSAVSSAFIASMESSLGPSLSDTMHALLKILISKVDNETSEQDASLPVWTGPSSTEVWIQALAYLSLSTSLLAAFGAVLCK